MSNSVVDDTAVVEIEDSNESDEADELVSESLVEEVSIDGMCGVY
ncbi:MAG: mycofactocin precursor [Geodermatophilaceae bacterium]|nr:mycofactocin precursor [Geodermatophilaceae bacterium]